MPIDYQTASAVRSPSKGALWTGWVLSVLPSLLLFFSAYMKVARRPEAIEGFAKLGYPEHAALWIGIVEITCTVLYLIPRTAVLGAILLTGYLGGATNTHVRVGEPFFMPVLVGVVVWLGLFLREPRLRSLIPQRGENRVPGAV
jgi:hypothetical protein